MISTAAGINKIVIFFKRKSDCSLICDGFISLKISNKSMIIMAIIVAGKGIHWLNPTLIKQIKKTSPVCSIKFKIIPPC